MIVVKFGGTSVGSVDRVQNVMHIIRQLQQKDEQIAVVVSAFAKTTDQLIRMAHLAAAGDGDYRKELQQIIAKHHYMVNALIGPDQLDKGATEVEEMLVELNDIVHGVFLIRELTPRSLDFIVSFGERLSAFIISQGLQTKGTAANYLDTRRVIKTDAQFGAARVDTKPTYANLRDYFHQVDQLTIVTGFIASTPDGVTTTLGRGGSDYTASLLGAALGAREIQIWTDVDGVMTADPRTVRAAFPIENLSYEEAMELSHFGARVIYPPTMQPALDQNIPIRIKNSLNPDFSGTLISQSTFDETVQTARIVKGISSIEEVALLRVQGSGMIGVAGIANRLFGTLARQEINIILITQASSEHSICFAVKPEDATAALQTIEAEFELEIQAHRIDPIVIETDLSIVAIVGEGMRQTSGIAGRMFDALGKNGISVAAIAQGSSELNISVVIPRHDEPKALRALHEAFFLSDYKTLNLFIVGVGLIGSTLIEQIEQHRADLREQQRLNIRTIALTNSRHKIVDEMGLDLNDWRAQLTNSTETMEMDGFITEMDELNLQNSVFVDCTADDTIITYYEQILEANISIVTPNKKANTGPLETYRRLKWIADRRGVKYLYETNVGAGLPIISTLNDLKNSGDRILKVEAILSGTISYIFNSFVGEAKFSQIVHQAREKGYTEPDPRDDLNGLDVARKLLILARETGRDVELKDIEVENIIPESCREASSVEDFLEKLGQADAHFEQLKQDAAEKDSVLRYIASFDDDSYQVALTMVDSQHPFYDLSGSDNIIAFTTERYRERPLVVKGPGAGAEVTAAGVFADIIRLANYLG